MRYYGIQKDNNSLAHWKYKRKYKGKNGKWVYVYDDGKSLGDKIKDNLGITAKEQMEADRKSLNEATAEAVNARSEYGKANETMKRMEGRFDKDRKSKVTQMFRNETAIETVLKTKAANDTARDKAKAATDKEQAARTKLKASSKVYDQTVLGKAAKGLEWLQRQANIKEMERAKGPKNYTMKKTAQSKPQVSKEYMEELEYNSRRNKY